MRPGRRVIAEVIVGQINKGMPLNSLAKEVAAYLLTENRTKDLGSVMREVMAIRAEAGMVEATATVARSLEVKVKEDIKQLVKSLKPSAKDILIDEKLDESLIGGLKLDVIDKSLDMSLRAKLNKLKQLATAGGV